ncbi:MAG: hypothetical protein ACPGJS_13070 [Flammeovirgaceae bacterium]
MESNNNIKLLAVLLMIGFIGLAENVNAQGSDTTKTTYLTSSGNTYGIGKASKWSLGFHLMYAKPLFQLDDNGYRDGFSIDAEVLSPSILNESSFWQIKFGGHIDYTGSGNELTEVELQEPAGEMADYRVRNQSVGLHLIGRLTTKEMAITPYLDGIIGGRGLFSTQIISLQDQDPDFENTSTEFLTDDLTFIYGGSLGALVKLGNNSFADFRVTYSQGSRADFVSLNQFDADLSTYPNYEHTIMERVRTPMLFFSAGVVFNITSSHNGSGYESIDSNNRRNSGGVFYGGTRTTRRNRNNEACEPTRRPRTKKKLKLKTGTGKPKADKPKPAY